MSLQLIVNGVAQLFPLGFFVQWTLKDATESGVYTFDVYRGGSTDGPWELVQGKLQNQYSIVDNLTVPFPQTTENVLRPNQLALFRLYIYRVVVTSPSGQTAEGQLDNAPLDEGALNDRRMVQFARKAIRDFRLTLKFNGTRCVLLKRRRWGIRCDCVDKKTREVVRASCRKCWGTGIVGGYWDPVSTYARRSAGTAASAITPENKSDTMDGKIWLPDYPALESDDLIIFLKENTRWRIDQSVTTQIRLQDVHQVLSVQQIDHANIIYRLAINPTQIKPLY
jgi:hypothetical protein